MKNLFKITLFAAAVFTATQGHAQTHKDSTFSHKVKKTVVKIGHKTSEVAAKGDAAITDKKYEGKCGPHGETVYINKNSHYFYVNKTGHRVYVSKSHLMDKKM